MNQNPDIDRNNHVRLGRRLEYFTILYNSLEGLISIAAGLFAGSVSLIGFGIDSAIEMTSGAALLWRLRHEMDKARREAAERISLRIVGVCFLALAAYLIFESAATLWRRDAPERSIPGIVLAAVSVVVMPIVARAKRRIAAAIASNAMRADSRQTDLCAYLSAILLVGLLLNALFRWWWADPVAALLMVPIIAREGQRALKRETCCSDDCAC
jgi:divalent metal cation (Fe/Co/Zn/Cd) transporter